MTGGAAGTRDLPVSHRATYTLEIGEWHATCRVCGWLVVDKDRRQAAARFRQHIRATHEEALATEGAASAD
jgi:hypothetical protein